MHNYTYIQRGFPNQPCFITGWLKEWILPRASSSDLTSKEMISWMDGKCFRPVKYTPTYANFVFSPFKKCATLGSLVLWGCLQKGTAKSQKGHWVMILGAFSILRRSDRELDTIYIYIHVHFVSHAEINVHSLRYQRSPRSVWRHVLLQKYLQRLTYHCLSNAYCKDL